MVNRTISRQVGARYLKTQELTILLLSYTYHYFILFPFSSPAEATWESANSCLTTKVTLPLSVNPLSMLQLKLCMKYQMQWINCYLTQVQLQPYLTRFVRKMNITYRPKPLSTSALHLKQKICFGKNLERHNFVSKFIYWKSLTFSPFFNINCCVLAFLKICLHSLPINFGEYFKADFRIHSKCFYYVFYIFVYFFVNFSLLTCCHGL